MVWFDCTGGGVGVRFLAKRICECAVSKSAPRLRGSSAHHASESSSNFIRSGSVARSALENSHPQIYSKKAHGRCLTITIIWQPLDRFANSC